MYRDPAFRDAFQQELESRRRAHMWGQMRVLEVGRPELAAHVGHTLEEIAARLPRDLREVYWNDPRRRAMRAEITLAAPVAPAQSSARSGGQVEATTSRVARMSRP